MKLDGHTAIHAPRSTVWAFVTDPDLVAACLPGVQSIENLGGGRFKAHAKVNLGFFSAKVVVDVEYTEIHEPDDATLHAHGKAPGSAVDVTAKLVLASDAGGSTLVDWTAEVEVSGMLAGAGLARIEGTARTLVGETLDCVRAKLEA